MLKSLEDFVSYSDFASRVRKIEKESKANSKSFHIEEQEKCFRNEFAFKVSFKRLVFENITFTIHRMIKRGGGGLQL